MQGGLGQVSAPKTGVTTPVAGKVQPFNSDVVQAENLEKTAEETTKPKAVNDLDEQRQAMNGVLTRLREQLDARKNRLFDPVMMQAAAGFLKPTKTGSFGESLGYAAENASVASERDQVRQSENLKLEAELADKEMSFRRQLMGDRFMQRFKQDEVPTSTSDAAASISAAPVLGEATPVAQLSASQRILQGKPQTRQVTEADLAEARRIGDKDLIATVEGMMKRQLENQDLALKAQANEQAAKSERVEFTPQGAPDNFVVKVPRALYDTYLTELDKLDKNKTPQGRQEYFNFLKKNNLLTQSQLPKESSEPITNAPSANETEIQKQAGIARAQEAIKADEVLKTVISTSNGTAQERIIAADQIYALANSKETGRVFEFFTKPTIRNILATAVEGKGGVRTPIGSVEIENIKKAMLLAGATPKEMDAAQTLLRSTTMLNLQDTISLMPKQGQITEGERALIGNLNPNIWQDTRNSAMIKSQLSKARGEYDQDIAEIYSKWADKNPNGFITNFKQSKEFKERYNDYDKYTRALAKKYFPDSVPAPSSRRNTGPLESQIQ
jgi:hypothetical protein